MKAGARASLPQSTLLALTGRRLSDQLMAPAPMKSMEMTTADCRCSVGPLCGAGSRKRSPVFLRLASRCPIMVNQTRDPLSGTWKSGFC